MYIFMNAFLSVYKCVYQKYVRRKERKSLNCVYVCGSNGHKSVWADWCRSVNISAGCTTAEPAVNQCTFSSYTRGVHWSVDMYISVV